jgi:hypothetical protein
MAQPKRDETMPTSASTSQGRDYGAGGPVGRMQADLARRLAADGLVRNPAHARDGERTLRLVSAAAGCAALAMAYAGAALLILR